MRAAAGLDRLRDSIARSIERRLGGDEGLLATSFLLGARNGGPEARGRLDAFARAGVAHLLSVSGLHVALIGGGAALFLGLLPIGWRARALALGAAIAGYATFVGWSGSVTRAAATGVLWAVLRASGRRPEPRAVLLVVLAATLLRQPAAWRDPGLRLSYLVTLALLGAARARTARRVRWGLACVAAQGAAWPLVLGHQGSGSPVYLGANAILVPISGLIPPVVLMGLAGSALPGFPAEVALGPARGFLHVLLVLVRAAASLCDAWPVGSSLGPDLALAASVAVAVGWNLPCLRPPARLAASAVLCAGVTLIGQPPGRTPALLMLDTGQGESWLMVWKKETWLIDAGPTPGHGDRPGAMIVPALRSYGRRRVSRLFLTHDDEDHSGGVAELIAQQVRIETIHPPAGWQPGAPTSAFLAWAQAGGTQIEPLQCGDTLRGGDAMVIVENPDAASKALGDNQGCLVLRIETAHLTLLVTGDAPARVLERCARPARETVVLSAAHHGSATSTPERLLSVMRPGAVLVSVGRENRFGHPSAEVIERIRRCGALLRRTDRDGTLTLERCRGVWRVRAGVP
jgi:competence protein ComEC